jgi:hypothetical protein
MSLIAKGSTSNNGGDFLPCPLGAHPAVCVDVVDLGLVEQTYKGETKKKHMIRLVWEAEVAGERFLVFQRYGLSLHNKSVLRKHLKSWRGKDFTDAEVEAGFDVEKLLGKSCLLVVSHNNGDDGKIWTNVDSILPPPGMAAVQPSGTYVRVKDRPPKDASPAQAQPKRSEAPKPHKAPPAPVQVPEPATDTPIEVAF